MKKSLLNKLEGKMNGLGKTMYRILDVVVISGVGTGIVGAVIDRPVLMYSAIAGTAITAFAGAYYHDREEKRGRDKISIKELIESDRERYRARINKFYETHCKR